MLHMCANMTNHVGIDDAALHKINIYVKKPKHYRLALLFSDK